MVHYGGAIPRNILNAHFAPPPFLNIIFIPNFVHHHFLPKLLQGLRHLLPSILINLISCGASQSTIVLMVFFLQWAIWLPHHKHIMQSPRSPSRNHIFFIVLHSYVKPYKCICFYIYNSIVLHDII